MFLDANGNRITNADLYRLQAVDVFGNSALLKLRERVPAGNTVALVGDSISYNNVYTNSNSICYSPRGFMTWANVLLNKKRMDVVAAAGISGAVTATILASLRTDVIDANPGVCVVHAGVNDIFGELLGATTVINNLRSIYRQLLDAGILTVATTIMGVGTGHSSYNTQSFARMCAVNDWIRRFCAATPGMVLCDFQRVVASVTDASGGPTAGYFYDTPSLHPNTTGAHLLGTALANALSPFLADNDRMVVNVADSWDSDARTITSFVGNGQTATVTLSTHRRQVGDRITLTGANEAAVNSTYTVLSADANTFTVASSFVGTATGTISSAATTILVDDGLMQGTGGTVSTGGSGTAATGWVAERSGGTPTFVCSIQARADGLGSNQRLVITSGANGDDVRLRGPDVFVRINPGDLVQAEAEITVSSAVNLKTFRFWFETIQGGVAGHYFDAGHSDLAEAYPSGFTGVFRTPPCLFTAAATRTRVNISSVFSGAGGAQVDVGRVTYRKLDTTTEL